MQYERGDWPLSGRFRTLQHGEDWIRFNAFRERSNGFIMAHHRFKRISQALFPGSPACSKVSPDSTGTSCAMSCNTGLTFRSASNVESVEKTPLRISGRFSCDMSSRRLRFDVTGGLRRDLLLDRILARLGSMKSSEVQKHSGFLKSGKGRVFGLFLQTR